MREVKRQFRFPSNKLDFIAQRLGVGAKVQHAGFQLWIDCMNGDPKAWEQMRKYQIGDVELLPKLIDKLKPWIRMPTFGLYGAEGCPRCGSSDAQKRGFDRTSAGVFQRYQCTSCGGWFKSAKRVDTSEFRAV